MIYGPTSSDSTESANERDNMNMDATMTETDRWAMAPAGLLEVDGPWMPDHDGKPSAVKLMRAMAGIMYTVPGSTMDSDYPWIGTEHWAATGPNGGGVWDALESKRMKDDGEQYGSGRAWRRPLKGAGYSGKFEPTGDAPNVRSLVDAARGAVRVEVRPLVVKGRPVTLTGHDGEPLAPFVDATGAMVTVSAHKLEAVGRVIGAPSSGPWMVTAATVEGTDVADQSKPLTIAPGADRAIGSTPTVALIMPVRIDR